MPMPRPMTDTEALAEAHRRWGERGAAWHPSYEFRGGPSWCACGLSDGTDCRHRWMIYGVGESWEAAFRDAEERGNAAVPQDARCKRRKPCR